MDFGGWVLEYIVVLKNSVGIGMCKSFRVGGGKRELGVLEELRKKSKVIGISEKGS